MSRTIRIPCAAAIMCLLASLVYAGAPVIKQSESKPLASLSGSDSKITKKTYVRVMSQKQWADLWQKHAGKELANYVEQPSTLNVDFRKCMVVAVFQGAMTNCAGVAPIAVIEQKDKIVVRYANQWFQTCGPIEGGAVKTSPYGFFVLPRSKKPIVLTEGTPTAKADAHTLQYEERGRL